MKPPIDTLTLFPVLDELLLRFLRGLSPEEWERPTLAPRWRVMDVALHLLDGNLRTLSMLRDGHFGVAPAGDVSTHAGLVAFLNELNADWIRATRRLSPAVVLGLLEQSGREYCAFLHTLDPGAPAAFAVAWAGEAESPNWFHVAREYTEKWHHQQQIRQAVGRGEAALLAPELYQPYLETSLRALPHHYRAVAAPEGTVLQLVITGPGAGQWFLHRGAPGWELGPAVAAPAARIELDGTVAWRLFARELDAETARHSLRCTGPQELTAPFYSLTAVMA
ncbi:maleylpyruvate isomerase N-terminal domain-containing protein [Hymenobacter sp. B81]|uniref:maleylpyruvate isomerase N-terminal domain-containing protein n=1 Tax=Hymenobacter sp. B81 TaxID=3344878 RepID=UPI0037DD1ECE